MRTSGALYHLTILIIIYVLFFFSFNAMAASDADLLLKFKDSISNNSALFNWVVGSTPCTREGNHWLGVLCEKEKVLGLQLENMGFVGPLNIDMLAGLSSLRTISFKDNNFNGAIPRISKLGVLKSVFLSNNRFSGDIPEGTFEKMGSLKKLDLSRNGFTGGIPVSLATLPRLLVLRLEENRFSGKIPDFQQQELSLVNVSYNELEGEIPAKLRKMQSSAFEGNKDLCGDPLITPCKASDKSPPISAFILLTIAIVLTLALTIIIMAISHRGCPSRDKPSPHQPSMASPSNEGDQLERGGGERKPRRGGNPHGSLTFVRDDRDRFDLQDMLKASAEVLGSGRFGSCYKAVIMGGPSLVVKRFREMNGVGRDEFEEHMTRLGRLRHPNLLPLVAFYYRKEEKLLVSDFVPNGSLAHALHGNRTPDNPSLKWPTRLKIVKGVASGLEYLYNQLPTQIPAHGHLKSSKVLLGESFHPFLTDYASLPVISPEPASQYMFAYTSPEYAESGQISRKSDVWTLGILILEILTGDFPPGHLRKGKIGLDLGSWVDSVMRKVEGDEVFDTEMEHSKSDEELMLKLLQIGLECCEKEVDQRLDLREAVERIEELRVSARDAKNSISSEGDAYYSTKWLSDEDMSLSTCG